jgi:hypothetical protein
VNEFHKLVSKKAAFLLFNVGTIIYLIFSGSLKWNGVSLFSYGAALLLMNGIAWFSSRNFKDWK